MRTLLLLALLSVLLPSQVRAEIPGLDPQIVASNTDVSYLWLKNLPSIYHRVFGEYPSSWAAIEQAGLFSAPLRSVSGKAIDPDDGKIDFLGDLVYEYRGLHQVPLLHQRVVRNGIVVHQEEVNKAGPTYETNLRRHERRGGVVPSSFKTSDARLQMGLAAVVNYGLLAHQNIYGKSPRTAEEYLQSMFSAFGPGCVSPVSGMPLFSGMPGCLEYVYNQDVSSGHNPLAHVIPVTSSGDRIKGFGGM